jgi:hypothetical protein
MNTIRTLGIAAAAVLSLGVGAAMAQENPNDTISGAAYLPNPAPLVQAPAANRGAVQSGSSDVSTNPAWTPGVPYNNEGGLG